MLTFAFAWSNVLTFAFAWSKVLTYAFALVGDSDDFSFQGCFASGVFEHAFVGMRGPLCVTHGLLDLRARPRTVGFGDEMKWGKINLYVYDVLRFFVIVTDS